jgi:hypothetical protein
MNQPVDTPTRDPGEQRWRYNADILAAFEEFRKEEEWVREPILPMGDVLQLLLLLPPTVVAGLAAMDTHGMGRLTLLELAGNLPAQPEVWAALAPLAEDLSQLDEMYNTVIRLCDEAHMSATEELAAAVGKAARASYDGGPHGYDLGAAFATVLAGR